MLIDNLLTFCNGNYNRGQETCPECAYTCQGACRHCLDDIHFRRVARDYNCSNMAYCYVCRYVFKYASEIEYLIGTVAELGNLVNYDIMSLGCGPSTDFFGFTNFMERSNSAKEIVYVGVDYNQVWRPIHHHIAEIAQTASGITPRYIYQDIFQIIQRLRISETTWRPNILILQYVISDMVAKGQNMINFITQVGDQIIRRMPRNSFIVMNDINHNRQARDYFEDMQRFLLDANLNIEVNRYYFENRHRSYTFPYGIKHSENNILTEIPSSFYLKYDPWDFCSSAQMVIRKVA